MKTPQMLPAQALAYTALYVICEQLAFHFIAPKYVRFSCTPASIPAPHSHQRALPRFVAADPHILVVSTLMLAPHSMLTRADP